MAKVASKGTVLSIDIATTLTAVAQLTDVSYSGLESETYDCTTLDSGVFKELGLTGYSEPGELSFSGFYDTANAGHQNLGDLIATPAEASAQITFSDSGVISFETAGMSLEITAAMADGVKFSATAKATGAVTLP